MSGTESWMLYGERVTVPPPAGQWEVRFGTSAAAAGWEELCRHALPNTRRCLEALRTDPRSGAGRDRQHRLRRAGSGAPPRPPRRRLHPAPDQAQARLGGLINNEYERAA